MRQRGTNWHVTSDTLEEFIHVRTRAFWLFNDCDGSFTIFPMIRFVNYSAKSVTNLLKTITDS